MGTCSSENRALEVVRCLTHFKHLSDVTEIVQQAFSQSVSQSVKEIDSAIYYPISLPLNA